MVVFIEKSSPTIVRIGMSADRPAAPQSILEVWFDLDTATIYKAQLVPGLGLQWDSISAGIGSHTHVLADITDAGLLAALNSITNAYIDNGTITGTKVNTSDTNVWQMQSIRASTLLQVDSNAWVQWIARSSAPPTPSSNRIYLDDGTNRADGKYGWRYWTGSAYIDITDTSGVGSGDVVGPAGATDNAIVRYNSITGKLLQDSFVTITDNGTTVLPNSATHSPLSMTARSSPPSTPSAGDIYLDDGTNTASTVYGFRRYNGSIWEDVGATAGGSGSIDITDGTTTVSPASQLSVDPTHFDIVDGGSGDAQLSLVPASIDTTELTPDAVDSTILDETDDYNVNSMSMAYLRVTGTSDIIQTIIKANATQTNPLAQFLTSADAVLLALAGDGGITWNGGTPTNDEVVKRNSSGVLSTGKILAANIGASGTPSSSTFLRGDDTWATPSGGGDVSGPGSSTDNAIARWDSTSGTVLQDSLVTIDDSGNVNAGGLTLTNDLPVTEGGTGASDASGARTNLGLVIGTNVQAYDALLADLAGLTLSEGDILYYDGANLVNLGIGTEDQVLTSISGVPSWEDASGGGGTLAYGEVAVGGMTNTNTTSSSYADITGASITVSLTGTDLFIACTGMFLDIGVVSTMQIIVAITGGTTLNLLVAEGENSSGSNRASYPANFGFVIRASSLTTGSHTFKLRLRRASGANLCTANVASASFQVRELRD